MEDQIRQGLEALEDEYRQEVTNELILLAEEMRDHEGQRDKIIQKLSADHSRDSLAYRKAVRKVQEKIPDFQRRRNQLRQELAQATGKSVRQVVAELKG